MLAARSDGAGIRCPCATPTKGLCPSGLHQRLFGGRAARRPRRRKEHTPRKKRTQATRKKNTLLIDIEAKLQAGKGGGYERWAKVFNVKQMAQTYNYLREHGLLDYAELEEKAAAATEQFHALSAQIKAAETRMAEIAVLKTHIINYAKTRDVYAGYRKAGYSKSISRSMRETSFCTRRRRTPLTSWA